MSLPFETTKNFENKIKYLLQFTFTCTSSTSCIRFQEKNILPSEQNDSYLKFCGNNIFDVDS